MNESHGKQAQNINEQRPLRLAAVQIKYVPRHRAERLTRLMLSSEPLIELGRLGPASDEIHLLLTDMDYMQLRQGLRNSARDLLTKNEHKRKENLDKKLRKVLDYCAKADVDLVTFPECSIPVELIPTLQGFGPAVFAGVGLLNHRDVESLRNQGFSVTGADEGANAAVYVSETVKLVVTKKHRASGEEIHPGEGPVVVGVEGHPDRRIGLVICMDFLRELEAVRAKGVRVDAVLAALLTKTMDDFQASKPRDFIRVFANWGFTGGSTIVAPNLEGLFVKGRSQTQPVGPDREAVVIVDWDFYEARLSPLDPPRNRLVRYASILDKAESATGERTLGDLVNDMAQWTAEGHRAGAYDQSLRLMREHSEFDPKGIIGQAVLMLSQPPEDEAEFTETEFDCLKSHIVLDDVLREEELRHQLLVDVIERWLTDWESISEAGSAAGRFISAAQHQRRSLEDKVRSQRTRRGSPRSAGRVREEARGAEHKAAFETFYAVRLGNYEGQRAVETLPRQLDLLHTVTAQDSHTVRLAYRVSTHQVASGDLLPMFDVIAAADPDRTRFEDLAQGIGEQIGTVFSSGWDITALPADLAPDAEWITQLTLPADYVPAIADDWVRLIDYLRTLDVPTQVQMVVEPLGPSSQPDSAETLDEPIGFLSSQEQDAAGFFTRAARATDPVNRKLALSVYIAAQKPLPASVLRTIGRWLLRTEVAPGNTGVSPAQILSTTVLNGAAQLTPAQALRIFHAPYGSSESRGLALGRETTVSLPSFFTPHEEGLELGHARISAGSYDRTTPVRLDAHARRHHVYILGRSGSGKTNLLKNMARQDIVTGRGVAVIDPHGDLVDYLVQQVAGREKEVVLLDFGDRAGLPVLNPLDLDVHGPNDRNLALEEFISLLEKQSFHEFHGPRFEDLVRLAVESILDPGYPITIRSIVDCPAILRDEASRSWLQGVLHNRQLRSRWQQFEAQGGTEIAEVLHWALAKFSELTQDSVLGQVLGGGTSTVSIRTAVERNAVLLVKIPEWEMSRSAASFLGAFVQERIRRAIYSRWLDITDRDGVTPFHLYVDEFQTFATTGFEEMVAEARKFGLCLTLAHQNVRQLQRFSRHTGAESSALQEAVLGNVSTMVYLGGSSRDDHMLAPEFGLSPDQLRNLRRHQAAARVLFDARSLTCTLEFPLADAVPGLPKVGRAVRSRMVDEGICVPRSVLRDALEQRFKTLAGLAHGAGGDTVTPEDFSPYLAAEADGDGADPAEPAATTVVSVSWPWTAQDSLAETSYVMRDGQLHIVLRPGASGLHFSRQALKFSSGQAHRKATFTARQRRLGRVGDSRPLVISLPNVDETIRKVSYLTEDGVFTLEIEHIGDSDSLNLDAIKFSRGVLADRSPESPSEAEERD